MPDGKFHAQVGGVSGLAFAGFMAREETLGKQLLEMVGGYAGGRFVGAKLPDVFDPPTTPNHRALAHGVLPVGAGSVAFFTLIRDWQVSLRAKAEACAQERATERDALRSFVLLLQELALRFTAGFLAGILAGYVSHIAFDALTPMGIPLLA